MKCSNRSRLEMKESSSEASDEQNSCDGEGMFSCNVPSPGLCSLNTTKNVSEFKSRSNAAVPKAQRSKKGLHLGAQKANADIFEMKQKEIVEKRMNRSLEPPKSIIDRTDLQKLFPSLEKPPSNDESEDETQTPEKDFRRVTESYLLGLKSRPEHTHSAQDSMTIISQSSRGKGRSKKTNDCILKLATGYDFEKKKSLTPKYQYHNESSDAQRKFGSAKSISSDQYFGYLDDTTQYKSDMSRFTNCSSISSDDYFHRTPREPTVMGILTSPIDTMTVEDMTVCLKKGVNKVAGKLGTAVNDFLSHMPHDFGEF